MLEMTNYTHYLILFKNSTGRFDLRALYANANDQYVKIYGQTSAAAPEIIDHSLIEKFLKYSSG